MQVLEALVKNQGSVLICDFFNRLLWQQTPPKTARVTLQTYIHQLRKMFNDEKIKVNGKESYRLIKTVLDGYSLSK